MSIIKIIMYAILDWCNLIKPNYIKGIIILTYCMVSYQSLYMNFKAQTPSYATGP